MNYRVNVSVSAGVGSVSDGCDFIAHASVSDKNPIVPLPSPSALSTRRRGAEQLLPAGGTAYPRQHFLEPGQVFDPLDECCRLRIGYAECGIALKPQHFFRLGHGAEPLTFGPAFGPASSQTFGHTFR